jgi:V8-like Glu-specific endopeptidase
MADSENISLDHVHFDDMGRAIISHPETVARLRGAILREGVAIKDIRGDPPSIEETPATRALRSLYQQEKAAEVKRRQIARVATRREAGDTDRGRHTSVSNREATGLTSAPEFGELGKPMPLQKSPKVEVAMGHAAAYMETATATVDESMLLDAYWGSFGSASARALLRSQPSGRSLLEVVIGTDDRTQITNTGDYPWRCICSLVLTAADGTNWIGTGWLVSPRMLLTAGHCVYMSNQGGWVQQIEVIPGRNADERPFGSCIATAFSSVRGWVEDADREYDYGVIMLPEDCRYGDRLGWFGYTAKSDDGLNNMIVNLSGYPGDKPAGTQWFHKRNLTDVGDRVLTYDIDTAGGQSGAPVWFQADDGGGYGVGIHTNGDVAGNSATRITRDMVDNIAQWIDEVP